MLLGLAWVDELTLGSFASGASLSFHYLFPGRMTSGPCDVLLTENTSKKR